MKQLQSPSRVGLLDEIRGLCILGVVLFHGLYDLVYMFQLDIPFFHANLIQNYIQPIGAGAFIVISGIVSRYSKNNFKRGLQALTLGTVLTLVLWIFKPSVIVHFGILSLLGTGMLLYAWVEKKASFLLEVPSSSKAPFLVFLASFVLYSITSLTSRGFWGFFSVPLWELPSSLYHTSFLYPFGFPNSDFYSTDYFPLLPWLFLFIGGAAVGVYFIEGKMPSFFYANRFPFLAKIGKHSLLIYLLHQPLLYGIFSLFVS